MRKWLLMACLSVIAVSAQAQQIVPEPAPLVDASHEQWQVLSEPLLVDGLVYLPSGPNRFFDPNMMARTGVYRGIPIYQDRSLEPYSIVYVPIGGGQMRPYERRRAGELAGTTGSRTPSYPVEPTGTPSDEERIVASAGTTATAAPVAPPAATVVETPSASELMPLVSAARPPHEPNGIFIEFNGAKWFGSGRPVSYSTLFEQIGTYSGVPVYRLKTDHRDRVWVPVVPGGPLAPYSKH